MSPFDPPAPGATTAELLARRRLLHEYARTAEDPNEAGEDGRTLLLVTLMTCFEGDGEGLVADLLARGANPNRPSPWAIFTTLITVSGSIELAGRFVESGLRLDDVFDFDAAAGGLIRGPATLLDYLDAVRDALSPRRKTLDALARKHAGGLGGRRRFIEEAIALLESSGARRARELGR